MEASIKRILEKTLRKAAVGQATSKTTPITKAGEKESPRQKRGGVLSVVSWIRDA